MSEPSVKVREIPARRAILTDGRIVEIRPLTPDDLDQLIQLHADLPERDRYFRFFTAHPAGLSRLLGRFVRGDAHRLALGGFLGTSLVGVAHFEVLANPAEAEVALAVDHRHQAHGLGTLLLEHLASEARHRGVRRFVAEVLPENAAMVKVFRDAGWPLHMRLQDQTYLVTLQLVSGYVPAVGERERAAELASLSAILRPRSVAVVGASRRADAIGRAVLENLLGAGFTGTCWPVNPRAETIAGVRSVARAADLPTGVDLAVLCVPAPAVPEVAEECGKRGVRALVVITAGLTGNAELANGLLEAARRHGMRIVGPNCLGVINTASSVRLNASFARPPVPSGRIGVVTQSGGVGISLLEQFATAGLGVSSLVSTGDKYDVSSNDLLMWWYDDDATDLGVIYVESFGNPRKFSVLARMLAEQKPIIAVRAATTEAAQRAAASHTAAAATPGVTRDALFAQAGVIAVDSLTDAVSVAAVLSWQPVPAGDRVAIVGNVGGIGVLAADACASQGLQLSELSETTRAQLAALLPATAALQNPVDTTAGVRDDTFHECVRTVVADESVDVVIVLTAPTAVTDPARGIAEALATVDSAKPVVVVRVEQQTTVAPLHPADENGRTLPSFADPVTAATAVSAACRYGRWRTRPTGTVPDLPDIDIAAARDLVAGELKTHPGGGWLAPSATLSLLHHFGLPVLDGTVVTDVEQAVAAFHEIGRPIVMKALAERLLHKSRAGGVAVDLRDETDVRATFAAFQHRFGSWLNGVFIQPMAEPGREFLIGVHNDPTFGPLIAFGMGGVDTDLIADRIYRLVPLTDQDADEMLHSLRASPALFGPDAEPRLDTDAIRDSLLRIGRLAELVPEIAELDLNPLIASETGCSIVDARIRLEPVQPVDPYLRSLRA